MIARLHAGTVPSATADEADRFVGRDAELGAPARGVRRASRARAPRCSVVAATSASGKSALVRAFLARSPPRPLVLSGRCYERESVPYKAIDGVVDALTRHLLALPDEELAPLLPERPVRHRRDLPGAASRGRHRATRGPRGGARRSAGLAQRRPSPRCASCSPASRERARWCSASTICSGPTPTAPCSWAILRGRRRAADAARRHRARGRARARLPRPRRFRRIELSGLSAAEAAELARQLVPSLDADSAAAVAAAASGHPLFVEALARRDRSSASASMRLEDVLWANIEQLPADVREMLEPLGGGEPRAAPGDAGPSDDRRLGRVQPPARGAARRAPRAHRRHASLRHHRHLPRAHRRRGGRAPRARRTQGVARAPRPRPRARRPRQSRDHRRSLP